MPEDVTGLLIAWSSGDRSALDKLFPLVYAELRQLAGRHLGRERADHTLQTTGLVHEAYLRLVDQRRPQWQNRAHFFAIAAQAMRRILVDHARRQRRLKRGGEAVRLTLDEALVAVPAADVDLLALDDALTRLALLDAQHARLVELRFFGGLTIEETADAMGVSPATVKREWQAARAWLYRDISRA